MTPAALLIMLMFFDTPILESHTILGLNGHQPHAVDSDAFEYLQTIEIIRKDNSYGHNPRPYL